MRKQKADTHNVIDILENLHSHLEDCEFHHYNDADDMHRAKSEVLKTLETMIKRRIKKCQDV